MAGPWDKYAKPAAPTGPWAKYQSQGQRSAMADRIAAAKAAVARGETVKSSPQQAEIDRQAEVQARDPGAMAAMLLGGAQGATLGYGDEMAAVLASLSPNMTYDEALAGLRQGLGDARAARPVTAYGSEIAGSLVPGAGIGKAAMGANSLGGAMLRGAGVGAATGAVQGFGMGEGGADGRVGSALVGGAMGGLVGGAIPAVASGVGSVVRHVKDWRAGQAAVRNVANELGVSPQAAQHLTDAIGADDAALMAANIRAAGPGGMLADAGPSVQGALDAAMQRPGAAARVGMQQIDSRAAQSMQRINAALDATLGASQGAETAKAGIRGSTAAARQTAYSKAYSAPIDYASDAGRALEGMLPRIPQKAIRDANLLMQIDGDTSRQIMAKIADDGSVTFTRMPDVRQWDYIKRALDHAATSGEGQGALGGQTAMGRAYQGLSRQIRDTLKGAVPEYGAALDTAADAISQTRGIEAGYAMLRAGTTRESVRDALRGATAPEKEAIKQGVRDYLDDALANVRSVISDPNTDAREARKALGEMTSRAAREKIGLLLGKDAPKLYAALDEAQKALGLRAAVSQNSKTAARLAFGERSKALSEPGAIRSALSGKPIRAGQKMAEAATGATAEATARRTDRINAELVRLLTQPDQAFALNALAKVSNAVSQNVPNALAGVPTQRAINAAGFGALPTVANALAAGISNLTRR